MTIQMIRDVSGWQRPSVQLAEAAGTAPRTPSTPTRDGIRTVSGWQSGPLPAPEREPKPATLSAASRVDEVLAWVDGDPQRADKAWDVEVAGKRRPTLLRTLAVIADGEVAA